VHSGVKLSTNCWATFTTELEPWSPEPSLALAARPPNDFVHFGGQTPPDTTSGCLSLDLSKISYRTLKVNDERTRDKSGTQHKNGTIGCPGRHRNFPGTDPRKSGLSRENRDGWSPYPTGYTNGQNIPIHLSERHFISTVLIM
jgi:hypothetical protein